MVKAAIRSGLLAEMEETDAERAYQGFPKKLRHVPAPLRKTLTYNRGEETALAIHIFLADRHSPCNAARTKTPTGCCASTCPRARICRGTRNVSATPLHIGSIGVHESA